MLAFDADVASALFRSLRRWLAPAVLALLTVQCSAPSSRARPVANALRYQGLTLDEWCESLQFRAYVDASNRATVTSKDGRTHSVVGLVREGHDTGVVQLIEALQHFAQRDPRAIEILETVGRDLDGDVRDDVVEALRAVATSRAPQQSAACAALVRGMSDEDPAVAVSFLTEVDHYFADEDNAEDARRLGPAALAAFVAGCQRLAGAPEDEYQFAFAFESLAAVGHLAPESMAPIEASLRTRPLPWNAECAGDTLQQFAWERIAVDQDAPSSGLALALEAARAASELKPDDPHAWNTLAFAAWRLGLREEALAAVERAVAVAREQKVANLGSFERNERTLSDDANWTPDARARARVGSD
ncbi:MAG: hypothetical protein HZA52_06610 [Planctomycetes bacterium]|nr:hypothetical protein [Planctomycetota bacterium]